MKITSDENSKVESNKQDANGTMNDHSKELLEENNSTDIALEEKILKALKLSGVFLQGKNVRFAIVRY